MEINKLKYITDRVVGLIKDGSREDWRKAYLLALKEYEELAVEGCPVSYIDSVYFGRDNIDL